MHPLEDELFLTVYVMGGKGTEMPVMTIQDIDVSEPDALDMDVMPMKWVETTELTFQLRPGRFYRGAIDYMTGKATMAAMRYRRHIIRKREKERRRRLKHG